MSGLLRSTAVFSAMTFLSRISGLVRDQVYAAVFGANPAMDAFVVAFRIPTFRRRRAAEGSFSMAFVPVLAEYKARGVVAALVQFRQHRHERRRERALGEDPAQVVRDPVGDDEGADRRPGAEQRRLQQVARQPGEPGQERHAAEDGRGAQQAAAAHRPDSAGPRPAGLTGN